MVALDANTAGRPTIEVFDPLCPACKGFEGRLSASGLDEKLHRRALLFPLDNACNWMVGSAVHPGACAISEAVLCAGDKAPQVIDWAFENQEAIRTAAAADPNAAAKMATDKFPDLKSCIGSAGVKSKINKSLRWAVANQLPVLTPQIYVDGTKLCDEDTDLGMDYSLSRLLDAPRSPSPATAAGGSH
jgi:protein-disulfide isomerase